MFHLIGNGETLICLLHSSKNINSGHQLQSLHKVSLGLNVVILR